MNTLLETNPNFFFSFTTVIATQITLESCAMLASLLWGKVSLVLARTYGMIGYIRILIKEHYGVYTCMYVYLYVCIPSYVYAYN